MSTPTLVKDFYERIWNAGDEQAAATLLAEDFVFRGSLGSASRGREAFLDYVRSVRGSLEGYRCDMLDCVSEDELFFTSAGPRPLSRSRGLEATAAGSRATKALVRRRGSRAARHRDTNGQAGARWRRDPRPAPSTST